VSCKFYATYSRGAISEEEFIAHAEQCAECRQSAAFEKALASQIHFFRGATPSSDLWPKVLRRLAEVQREEKRSVIPHRRRLVFRVAFASVLFGLALAVVIIAQFGVSARYLSDAAVHRVEKKERQYERAIAELERSTGPELASAESDLFLLYRDKIETLDAQIAHCKEALENNPYSAHIRRYLLAAYQEKKETLYEVLEFSRTRDSAATPSS
jgi:hypothetical protein